jgi:subtilisin family serine protease
MPVRWGPNLSDDQIENWFGHVTDNGAEVVSCSWGAAAAVFPLSTRAFRAIENCAVNGRGGLGCVVCFAAGNDDHDIDNAPFSLDGFALHPNVITVSASTSVDTKADYSNFGDAISICAPSSGAGGRGVLTADVRGTYVASNGQTLEAGYSSGPFTSAFGGTSSACPLVAGICGLILSVDPTLTAVALKKLLESTARQIGSQADYDQNGHSRKFGYGCVNAEAALGQLLGTPAPNVA